jgi:hypothetical protein
MVAGKNLYRGISKWILPKLNCVCLDRETADPLYFDTFFRCQEKIIDKGIDYEIFLQPGRSYTGEMHEKSAATVLLHKLIEYKIDNPKKEIMIQPISLSHTLIPEDKDMTMSNAVKQFVTKYDMLVDDLFESIKKESNKKKVAAKVLARHVKEIDFADHELFFTVVEQFRNYKGAQSVKEVIEAARNKDILSELMLYRREYSKGGELPIYCTFHKPVLFEEYIVRSALAHPLPKLYSWASSFYEKKEFKNDSIERFWKRVVEKGEQKRIKNLKKNLGAMIIEDIGAKKKVLGNQIFAYSALITSDGNWVDSNRCEFIVQSLQATLKDYNLEDYLRTHSSPEVMQNSIDFYLNRDILDKKENHIYIRDKEVLQQYANRINHLVNKLD